MKFYDLIVEIAQDKGRFASDKTYDILRKLCLSRKEIGLSVPEISIAFEQALAMRGKNDRTINVYKNTLRMALDALNRSDISERDVERLDLGERGHPSFEVEDENEDTHQLLQTPGIRGHLEIPVHEKPPFRTM